MRDFPRKGRFLAVSGGKRTETGRHAVRCIAIHAIRIHQASFAGFSPGKLWFSPASR
jgi:hypothetical protein